MTLSKIFFLSSFSFISGVFLSSFFKISFPLILVLSIFALFSISIFWREKEILVFGFCILFFISGIFRFQMIFAENEKIQIRKFNDSDIGITLVGTVVSEPELEDKIQKLILEVQEIWVSEKISTTKKEKVYILTNKYPLYQYGDKLRVSGKLENPPKIGNFDWQKYLEKEKIFSQMKFPEIELIEKNQGNFILAKIFDLKERMRKIIHRNLPFPQSTILAAMILGDKSQIPKDLREKMGKSGISHISAISGLHVTVLSSLLLTFFLGLGFWRQQAIFLSLFFLTLFVIFTGFQPSAIRATIMGEIFLLSQYFGREFSSFRILFLVCAIMLFQNPFLLRYDLSFQLSFLAMLGIVSLFPILREIFKKFPNPFQLRDLFLITISAQYFTFPILIYNFDYFSLFSFLTNILIVPLLPLIIGLGFFFSFLGLFIYPISFIFSLPCGLFLSYLLKIVDFFSQPWAFRKIEVGWQFLPLFYLFLLANVVFLNKKFSQPFFLK